MEHHHEKDGGCCHRIQYPSAVQTLDEMDFEKGIWTAALDGDLRRLEHFLSKPAFNVDIRDQAGYTALHYAARKGNLPVCQRLISAGAQVNAQTRSCSSTPLHRSSQQGHIPVVQLLLKHGADPCLTDCDGMTALHKAAISNQIKACEILVKHNRELVTMKDKNGKVPVFDQAAIQ